MYVLPSCVLLTLMLAGRDTRLLHETAFPDFSCNFSLNSINREEFAAAILDRCKKEKNDFKETVTINTCLSRSRSNSGLIIFFPIAVAASSSRPNSS